METTMNIGQVSETVANGTSYKAVTITKGKTSWTFLQVVGAFNYVSVRKNHANPFCNRLGTEFKSFDHAQEKYTDPNLKSMILMAEMALK